jgi:hypothetical protein
MALYKSAYAAFQVLVRPRIPHIHPVTGVQVGSTKELTAEFGTHGGEMTITDPLTGHLETHALIHGHYFDSVEAAERLGWSPEELETVDATLDELCAKQPYLIAKVEHEAVTASLPWPTYDDTPWREVARFAITLGLAAEALAYERENKNRPKVVEELEAHLTKPVEVQEAVAAVPGMITL